jgi:hypothetical protein
MMRGREATDDHPNHLPCRFPGDAHGGRRGGRPMETLAGFAAYAAAMEQAGIPILGHVVLYSVYETRVTRDDLERWFRVLTVSGLDGFPTGG